MCQNMLMTLSAKDKVLLCFNYVCNLLNILKLSICCDLIRDINNGN